MSAASTLLREQFELQQMELQENEVVCAFLLQHVR
jgi:hypothetical protein